jgi:hypothetical protein
MKRIWHAILLLWEAAKFNHGLDWETWFVLFVVGGLVFIVGNYIVGVIDIWLLWLRQMP